MVFFSKIFTVFALPPGCIILGLFIFAAFFLRRRANKCIAAGIGAVLYLLSVEPVQDLLLFPLENRYPPLSGEAPGAQAIVVLGGGTVQASPEAGEGRDSLSAHSLKRLVYAFGLRDRYPAVYILSGGKVFDYGQETEADVAARFLVSLGLPPERVKTETESRNTWQNARSAAGFGYRKVVLVTSAWHMPRSVFCFEKNGISVIPAPTDYYCARNSKYDLLSFLPSMGAFLGTTTALHEYLGILSYRILY
jgi:uncharacterized SAM-binding protein YcdF (DUF218 family)